ncbi:MAG TPA: hypothetical protein VK968_03720 [Roseimicrobium sp.]|nr:hypothetical protein [Roseimicrobium sp.]
MPSPKKSPKPRPAAPAAAAPAAPAVAPAAAAPPAAPVAHAAATAIAGGLLIPPAGGAVVRMYRIGHGDCFLIAFAGDSRPVYVLIDCGYKPGSPAFIGTTPKAITRNIREATGGVIDVGVITHEHQDHVNGISASNFEGITFREVWMAWTEDPQDPLANQLRALFNDTLLGLVEARNQLAAAGDDSRSNAVDDFLEFELGGDEDAPFNPTEARNQLLSLGAAGGGSKNKQSMKLFKDKAGGNVRYLRPHEAAHTIADASNLRVFSMGPPMDKDRLSDLDPVGSEEFHLSMGFSSPHNYLASALKGQQQDDVSAQPPFNRRYYVPLEDIASAKEEVSAFYSTHYKAAAGTAPEPSPAPQPDEAATRREVAADAEWRRIDNEWLYASEQLALAMNNATNNASLVLAFELSPGGKVLLFGGDAQRGNCISWNNGTWSDGNRVVNTRDLLSRTVLYKVHHHASHNGTLNGKVTDDYPNLGWMGQQQHASEFTAMITAVRAWAQTQKGWNHPYPPIKDALKLKASGRILQTDEPVASMTMPATASPSEWQRFLSRVSETSLYFDLIVN